MGNIHVIIYPGQCRPISEPAVDRLTPKLQHTVGDHPTKLSRNKRRRKRQWMRIPDLLGNPI